MTEFWVVLYLHDWDPDGYVGPEIHSIHKTLKEAEAERASRLMPEK